MPITVDLSDDILPVGTYEVAITDGSLEDSQSSAFQYYKWELTVQEGEFAGRKLFLNTSLSPKARWKLREFLAAIGVPITQDGDRSTATFEPADLISRRMVVEVDTNTYEGQLRNNITACNSLDGFVNNGGGDDNNDRKPAGRERRSR